MGVSEAARTVGSTVLNGLGGRSLAGGSPDSRPFFWQVPLKLF